MAEMIQIMFAFFATPKEAEKEVCEIFGILDAKYRQLEEYKGSDILGLKVAAAGAAAAVAELLGKKIEENQARLDHMKRTQLKAFCAAAIVVLLGLLFFLVHGNPAWLLLLLFCLPTPPILWVHHKHVRILRRLVEGLERFKEKMGMLAVGDLN